MRRWRRTCPGVAPYSRNSASKLRSALFSPTVVFDTIGKNATIQAQTSDARNGSLTQMMIKGAIATIGVTCRMTAYGNRLISRSRERENNSAIAPPNSAAAASAARVIRKVTSSEENRLGPSVHRLAAIALGVGRT